MTSEMDQGKFEAILYAVEPSPFDILAVFQPKEIQLRVRQLGERLYPPIDNGSIIKVSPYMSRENVDRWIMDYYERGFTDYAAFVKSQVSWKDWLRLKLMRIPLDTRDSIALWQDFVNFERRRETEVPFLQSQLEEYVSPKIFDACLGSGATTLGLKLAGIEDIISNEIDIDHLAVAREEAEKLRIKLDVTSYDWREVDMHFKEQFDVVLCLGNSLTYLFKRKDQVDVLRNFRKILGPNGKLLIDTRNYANHFLDGDFRFSGKILYCGKDKVDARPVYVSQKMVVMEYERKVPELKAYLVLYPFKEGELEGLLQEAGFSEVTAFGDYKKEFNPKEPEFITYVCRK